MSAADSYQVWTDGACSKNVIQRRRLGFCNSAALIDLLGIVYHIIDINTKSTHIISTPNHFLLIF